MACIIIICMKAACFYASLSVGTPAAPRNIISTGCAVVWSPSAPGLSYRISVCRLQSTLNCPIATNCTNCSFASITGITESGSYNITVCSSSVVNGVPCMSEACAPPIIVGMLRLNYRDLSGCLGTLKAHMYMLICRSIGTTVFTALSLGF